MIIIQNILIIIQVVVIRSVKLETNLYTSVSELFCWRLCFNNRDSIYKFDNYIQATIIDFRLQKYIWNHFDKFPYIQENESNIAPKYINNFLYDNIKLQNDLDKLNYESSVYEKNLINFAILSEDELIKKKSEIKESISQTEKKFIENEKLNLQNN